MTKKKLKKKSRELEVSLQAVSEVSIDRHDRINKLAYEANKQDRINWQIAQLTEFAKVTDHMDVDVVWENQPIDVTNASSTQQEYSRPEGYQCEVVIKLNMSAAPMFITPTHEQ